MSERPGDVLRLSLNERVQHVVLMVCVIALVASGLALRFADTWFGRAVIALEGGMETRGLLHRAAAVGLMLLWAYHALYVVFTVRGHDQLMAALPRIKDLRDLVTALKFDLGAAGPVDRMLDGESVGLRERHGEFDFAERF